MATWGPIIVSVTSFVLILILYFGIYQSLENRVIGNPKLDYSLNFDKNSTYSEGNLSIVIGNNGHSSSKILNIYGQSPEKISIFSSILATQTGKVINNLTFDGNSIYTLNGLAKSPTRINNVGVDNIQSGLYYGFLYLADGNLVTIPITVSTEGKVAQVITLVVIGVLTSILFWEIFFIFNPIVSKKTLAGLDNKITDLRNKAKNNLITAQETTRLNKYIEKADNRRVRIMDINNRYLTRAAKILTIDVASVGFGILTGIIGIFSTSVVSLVEINEVDAFILFGIGLGIGSLKGFVDN
jgi:hypothetical protein